MSREWEDPESVEADLRIQYSDDLVDEWLAAARRKGVTWVAPWLRACERNHLLEQQRRYEAQNAPSRRIDDSRNRHNPAAVETAETIQLVAAYLRGSYEWKPDEYEPVAIRLIRHWLTKDDIEQLRLDGERNEYAV
jgi:hypothetical protein